MLSTSVGVSGWPYGGLWYPWLTVLFSGVLSGTADLATSATALSITLTRYSMVEGFTWSMEQIFWNAVSVDDNFSPLTAEVKQAEAITEGAVWIKLGSETMENI